MPARLLLLLALAAVLALAASCSDEEAASLSPERMARFDYGVRLSIACRRSTYRLGEALPAHGASDALEAARAWRSEAIRLDRELRAEPFEDFLRIRAGDLHAAAGSLKNALGALTRALRTTGEERRTGVRDAAGIVRSSGERLRVVGGSLGASACTRVDLAPERRLLPAVEQTAAQP